MSIFFAIKDDHVRARLELVDNLWSKGHHDLAVKMLYKWVKEDKIDMRNFRRILTDIVAAYNSNTTGMD
jgi:hypothetical protein